MKDAIVDVPGGCDLLLEVTPAAREERFPGDYNPWRKRLGIKIRAPPVDGRANEAVCNLIASVLGVANGAVQLKEGPKSNLKRVRVEGLNRDEVLGCLHG